MSIKARLDQLEHKMGIDKKEHFIILYTSVPRPNVEEAEKSLLYIPALGFGVRIMGMASGIVDPRSAKGREILKGCEKGEQILRYLDKKVSGA